MSAILGKDLISFYVKSLHYCEVIAGQYGALMSFKNLMLLSLGGLLLIFLILIMDFLPIVVQRFAKLHRHVNEENGEDYLYDRRYSIEA